MASLAVSVGAAAVAACVVLEWAATDNAMESLAEKRKELAEAETEAEMEKVMAEALRRKDADAKKLLEQKEHAWRAAAEEEVRMAGGMSKYGHCLIWQQVRKVEGM